MWHGTLQEKAASLPNVLPARLSVVHTVWATIWSSLSNDCKSANTFSLFTMKLKIMLSLNVSAYLLFSTILLVDLLGIISLAYFATCKLGFQNVVQNKSITIGITLLKELSKIEK